MYDSCMSSKIINISLPQELVDEIDKAAKKRFTSRSDFIRESVLRNLEIRGQLEYLHKKTKAAGEKAGIDTEEDIARVIKEVREGR